MDRRAFVTGLGAVLAAPLAAGGQLSTKRPLIAYLSAVTRERTLPQINAFVRGLRELGYLESRDFALASRFAEGRLDRLHAIAEELVRLTPDVFLTVVTPAAVEVRKLTSTIPIVCPLLAEPIRLGLIASQSRPGGNVTGVLFRTDGLVAKQLELALDLIPGAARIGFLVNVGSGTIIDRRELESTGRRLGIELVPSEVRTSGELDTAFRAFANKHVRAVIVLVDGMFFDERQRIAAFAAAARVPAIYGFRDHVDAGGLISYGVNLTENFHRAATYVAKILKGAKPGELPVEFPTKIEMVINLKTAKALGLTIPPSLLLRADQVIE